RPDGDAGDRDARMVRETGSVLEVGVDDVAATPPDLAAHGPVDDENHPGGCEDEDTYLRRLRDFRHTSAATVPLRQLSGILLLVVVDRELSDPLDGAPRDPRLDPPSDAGCEGGAFDSDRLQRDARELEPSGGHGDVAGVRLLTVDAADPVKEV